VVTEVTDGLGFEPRLQFDGPIESIEVPIADHLIPVLREALSNIAHHAEAGYVRIAVSVVGDVTLTVSDDGIGVPAEVLGGRGLTNMAERARALGGDFTIRPEPLGWFPTHLAGAGPSVTTAGMMDRPARTTKDHSDNPPASDSTTCQAVVTSVPVIATAPSHRSTGSQLTAGRRESRV